MHALDRPGVGDKVRLNVPENPRLHGVSAVVLELHDWGAHVRAGALRSRLLR